MANDLISEVSYAALCAQPGEKLRSLLDRVHSDLARVRSVESAARDLIGSFNSGRPSIDAAVVSLTAFNGLKAALAPLNK